MQISWKAYAWGELDTDLLYAILRLRVEVFVVEQTCYYQDLDGKDQLAVHLCGFTPDGQLAAYTRLLPRGVSYPEYASVGRVITAPYVRGKKLGQPLMQKSIDELRERFAYYGPIKISAQSHLEKFYGSLGFRATGESYLEDGIPHLGMVLQP